MAYDVENNKAAGGMKAAYNGNISNDSIYMVNSNG